MEAILTLSILAVLIAFVALFCYITDKLIGWHYDRRDAKRRRAHPELYKLFDAVKEKSSEGIQWRNEQIYPKKKQIDNILKDWNYYTDSKREQKEVELKRLREELQIAETIDRVLESELVELREQVKDYVKKHDIEWAKKWSW